MAIDSFDLSRALNSQSYAFKCWENFYYGNNTMGIDSKSMGEIKQTWKEEIPNWQANALDDENAYEIPDDDFDNAYKNGRQAGQDATGYDGKTGGTIARGVGDATLASAGAVGAQVTKSVVTKAATKALSTEGTKNALTGAGVNAVNNAAKKGTQLTTQEAGKAVGKSAGSIVGCVIGLATATAYMAKKPNKTEKEACDKLQDTMAESQAATMSAQEEMAAMGEELMTLSDEAATYNEEANEQIEEEKTEYDMYMQTYTALKEKAESGEQLTEEEKALYTEIVGLLTESGEVIQEVQDDTSDTVTTIYDDMGTFQEGYDYAAETVAETVEDESDEGVDLKIYSIKLKGTFHKSVKVDMTDAVASISYQDTYSGTYTIFEANEGKIIPWNQDGSRGSITMEPEIFLRLLPGNEADGYFGPTPDSNDNENDPNPVLIVDYQLGENDRKTEQLKRLTNFQPRSGVRYTAQINWVNNAFILIMQANNGEIWEDGGADDNEIIFM